MKACYTQEHVGVSSEKGKLSNCSLKKHKIELKNIKIEFLIQTCICEKKKTVAVNKFNLTHLSFCNLNDTLS